jgi:DNA-binding XRE family transcriptional regulator
LTNIKKNGIIQAQRKGGDTVENLKDMCIRYRAKNRLTQRQMGALCGVDRTVIISIEKGRSVYALAAEKVKIVLEGEKE